jgi:hypothetical protein
MATLKLKPQPVAITFISIDMLEDKAVEETDPYAVMWAKVQQIAEVLNISEREAQQVVLGRICATPSR